MKKLISFSLYGSDSKYIQGAIQNAQMIQSLGANWRGVFYVGKDTSEVVTDKLQELGAVTLREKSDWHPNGMFWRFNVVRDFEFEYAMVRDTDSRILDQELCLLDEWFASGKILHIIRDHPNHSAVIMGGLWGVSNKAKTIEIDWLSAATFGVSTGQDQDFLRMAVWPKLKHSVLEHDSFHIPFSFFTRINRSPLNEGYIGEAIDQNGICDKNLRLENLYLRRKILLRIRKSLQLYSLKNKKG